MARSGIAKGANKGHVTEQREVAARPSRSKGVSSTSGVIVALMALWRRGGVGSPGQLLWPGGC